MNKRTQILALAFGVVIAYLLVDRVAYPVWIEPLLTIDKQIAEREQVLDELEKKEADVEHAKRRYERYAQRAGYMDVTRAKIDLRKRLTDLLDKKHKLTNPNVDKGRAHPDRKTGIDTITLGFSGDGPLESVVKVLKDLAELPDLMQVTRVDLSPSSSNRKSKKKDQVNISATLTVRVLPQQKLLGEKLTDEKLQAQRPKELPRCQDFAYASVWQADPFSEHEEPVVKVEVPTRVVTNDEPEPLPPPPPADYRWEDRSRWELHMALLQGDGTTPGDEVQLVNVRDEDQRRYAAVGEELDGGVVLCVHHRGVLVGREDGDFVYPLGARLDEPIRLAEASQFPELQAVATRLGPRPELPVKPKGNSTSSSRPTTVSARPDRDEAKTTTPRQSGPRVRPSDKRGRETPTVGKGRTPAVRDKSPRTPAVKPRHTPAHRPASLPEPEPDDEVPDE